MPNMDRARLRAGHGRKERHCVKVIELGQDSPDDQSVGDGVAFKTSTTSNAIAPLVVGPRIQAARDASSGVARREATARTIATALRTIRLVPFVSFENGAASFG